MERRGVSWRVVAGCILFDVAKGSPYRSKQSTLSRASVSVFLPAAFSSMWRVGRHTGRNGLRLRKLPSACF